MFQAAGTPEGLAVAKADRKGAHKQLPVCDERKMLAVVTHTSPFEARARSQGNTGDSFCRPSCSEQRLRYFIILQFPGRWGQS